MGSKFEGKSNLKVRSRVGKKRHMGKAWNPYTSKWKAAMEVGADVGLNGNENILYLGASSGTTVGHLSELTKGLIFGVEISAHMAIKFVRLAIKRDNIVPLFSDARDVDYIREKLENYKMDILFQDITSRDQVDILVRNSELVDKNCKIFLSLKTQSISQKNWHRVGEDVRKALSRKFEVVDMRKLEPFHQKHYFFVLKKR